MTSRTPVAYSVSPVMALLSLTLLGAMIFVADRILPPAEISVAPIVGSLFFIACSKISKRLLVGRHQQGMRLVRAGQFQAAIGHFQASYDFLSGHAWIDRWRCLTLLSASAMSFREMALCNIAFCCSQIGDGRSAKAYYERALREFPGSGLATAALNLITSAEDAAQR